LYYENDFCKLLIFKERIFMYCANRQLRNSLFSSLHGLFLLAVSFLLLLPGCGGKEVKKVSPESLLAQEAFALADTLKSAYVEKDRARLEAHSTESGYRELLGSMKSFDSADLSFTPTWVEIQDATVHLTVSWKGTWAMKGKNTEERGMAVFVFEGTPLKLRQVQRANPFRQPE
jgi:hypothetical protein